MLLLTIMTANKEIKPPVVNHQDLKPTRIMALEDTPNFSLCGTSWIQNLKISGSEFNKSKIEQGHLYDHITLVASKKWLLKIRAVQTPHSVSLL